MNKTTNKLKSNFRWWYAIVSYIALMFALLFNSFLFSITEAFFYNTTFSVGALFNVIQFVFMAMFSLWAVRLTSKHQLTRMQLGVHFKGIFYVLTIATVLAIIFYVLSILSELFIESLRVAGNKVSQSFALGENLTNDMLLLLSVGLFAPVAEEIVFRGIMFQSIVEGLKNHPSISSRFALLSGLAVSSFLFASNHGGGGQNEQMIFFVIMSIFTGLGLYYTKNIFVPIYIHAINNNIVFLTIVYKVIGVHSSHAIILIVLSLGCLLFSFPLGLLFSKILSK